MSMRVLLVDDEEELVSALAERLSFRDIQADYATTGEEALRLVGQGCYDVGVLDVKMPGMSGLELQQELSRACPSMKFIFLTGHGSMEDYQAGAKEAGARFYMAKPAQIDTLIAKMHELLGA